MELRPTIFYAALLWVVASQEQIYHDSVDIHDKGFQETAEREYELPVCADSEDHTFANCPELKKQGLCHKHPKKMTHFCPLTCKLCRGALPNQIGKAMSPPRCFSSEYGCCKDGKTHAQGPDYIGCPEKCYDEVNFFCDFYHKQGMCEQYKSTLLRRCPRKCGFCEPEESKCEDEWPGSTCAYLAYHNMCDNSQIKSRMESKCQQTCGKCPNHAPALEEVAPECIKSGEGCCWDKKTPISHGCPACNNLLSTGFCNRFRNDCFNTREIKGVRVRSFCPRTCGLCLNTVCSDDIIFGIYCQNWKKIGECEYNEQVMRSLCAKTCGFCRKNFFLLGEGTRSTKRRS